MTRKDYIQFAAELRFERRFLRDREQAGFDVAVGALIAALQRDNPRFDRDRFLATVYAVEGDEP